MAKEIVQNNGNRSAQKSYRQLVRILARVFYTGEIPPREELIETTQNTTAASDVPAGNPIDGKKHSWRQSYEGLGIILLDFLTSDKVDGFVDETVIASELKLSSKFIRKTLRYLEGEHLLVYESVKYDFKRNVEEEPDDPDIQIKKRHETHVFWAVDYPRVLDIVKLKIHGIEALLKRNSGNMSSIMTYQCPSCGAEYSSLQAASLIDIENGVFRCEDCQGVLEERGGEEVAGFVQKSSNKERQHFFKDLTTRFEAQIAPVVQYLEALRGMDPPDPGSLKDWYTTQKNEATLRAQRLEDAKKKFKASGASGAAEMTEEQLLEWADRAEMVIALPGQATGSSHEEEGKELPAWFKKDEKSEEVDAAEVQHKEDDEKQRQLQMEYLQQYLRQVEASSLKQEEGVESIDDKNAVIKQEDIQDDEKVPETREPAEDMGEPVAKKIKVEMPERKDHDIDEDIDWEDA